MTTISNLSAQSVSRLQDRGLTEKQISGFSRILEKAEAGKQAHRTAKSILSSLSQTELKILQKSAALADPIRIAVLSDEGAQNLLSQPDRSQMVDLNNDGIVEVGEGKTISFPPVNAPDHVKEAWTEATAEMPWREKIILELKMHHQVYGFHLPDVPSRPPLPPDQQWSDEGTRDLLRDARAALEFHVQKDGWTESNRREQMFYDQFEEILTSLPMTLNS